MPGRRPDLAGDEPVQGAEHLGGLDVRLRVAGASTIRCVGVPFPRRSLRSPGAESEDLLRCRFGGIPSGPTRMLFIPGPATSQFPGGRPPGEMSAVPRL